MHEFSICESVVRMALREARRAGVKDGRIRKVSVTIGMLRQIMPEYMATAYSILTKGTAAEGSVLDIRVAPTTAKCAKCGWSGPVTVMDLQCAGCGERDVETTGGMELRLENMEVEED